MPETYLTRAGYQKLEKDLAELKKRKVVLSGEIGEAREKGDLKENAEYHSAKEKLGEIMGRIGKIQEQLQSARIIDELNIKKGEVQIGVKVVLLDKEDGEKYEWILVGQEESDPMAGKISVFSPLAQGILGHKVGEEVKVTLPAGLRAFKILKAEPAV
ncbi:MAG TPA: transcription elongation factor GreA [Elusimicrobiota bacterium]|jgi:transcription elongation factor GreA|nr:transcription elongation factor GreA [Elusimicrobiota bacterium]